MKITVDLILLFSLILLSFNGVTVAQNGRIKMRFSELNQLPSRFTSTTTTTGSVTPLSTTTTGSSPTTTTTTGSSPTATTTTGSSPTTTTTTGSSPTTTTTTGSDATTTTGSDATTTTGSVTTTTTTTGTDENRVCACPIHPEKPRCIYSKKSCKYSGPRTPGIIPSCRNTGDCELWDLRIETGVCGGIDNEAQCVATVGGQDEVANQGCDCNLLGECRRTPPKGPLQDIKCTWYAPYVTYDVVENNCTGIEYGGCSENFCSYRERSPDGYNPAWSSVKSIACDDVESPLR